MITSSESLDSIVRERAMSRLLASGSLAAAEADAFGRTWAGLVGRQCANAFAGWMAVLRCRTPQDLIAAHTDFVCDGLEIVRGACAEISDVLAAGAGEAVRLIDPAEPHRVSS
ncbi:MAG: phasin family protein [Caulobacteraceae bacterium]